MSSTPPSSFEIVVRGQIRDPDFFAPSPELGVVCDTLLGVLEDVANTTPAGHPTREIPVSVIMEQIAEQLGDKYPLTSSVILVDDRTVYGRTYQSFAAELLRAASGRSPKGREENFWRDLCFKYRADIIALGDEVRAHRSEFFDNTDPASCAEAVAMNSAMMQRADDVMSTFLGVIERAQNEA